MEFRFTTAARRRSARALVAAGTAATLTILLAACGTANADTDTGAGSTDAAADVTDCATESALPLLPEAQQAWYAERATSIQVCESPYIDWLEPVGPPPWKIGYSGTYNGNTFRQVVLAQVEALAEKYKEAGLVSELIVKDSGGDSAKQIQQISELRAEGVDAILTTSPPTSALNGTMKELYDAKIPVVSIDGDMSNGYYVGTGANLWMAGVQQAQWLVDQLDGEGNIIAVQGIKGISASDDVANGASSVFEQYPGINVVATVYGEYTESIAKEQILQALATNPQPIDGVFVQGSMEMAAKQALEQTGRPLVPITFGGAMNMGAYWRDNPEFIDSGTIYYPPKADTDVAFEVLIRTLEGQGPKIVSMVRPPVEIGYDDLAELVPADETTGSTAWLEAPEGTWWTGSDIDQFFVNPQDPLAFTG